MVKYYYTYKFEEAVSNKFQRIKRFQELTDNKKYSMSEFLNILLNEWGEKDHIKKFT